MALLMKFKANKSTVYYYSSLDNSKHDITNDLGDPFMDQFAREDKVLS